MVFSYDTSNPLFKLMGELNAVQSYLQHPSCAAIPKWQCGPEHVREFFDTYKEAVRIFHFGGHAFGEHLQLNDAFDMMRLSFVEALAGRICKYGGLKLVFLNGCSTQDQANAFLQNGVHAVIATTQPLKDRYGLAFARMFYLEFCKKNKPLQEAFDDTMSGFLSDYQAEKNDWIDKELESAVRGFEVDDPPEEEAVYQLHIHPAFSGAKQEKFTDWHTPVKTALSVPVLETTAAKTDKVAPDSFLLCNRHKEARSFSACAKQKLDGGLLEPVFFFIHDDEQNCPYELGLRFQKYPEEGAALPSLKVIELESLQGHFGGDEKYKLALSEQYARQFAGAYDGTLNRWVLQKVNPDSGLIMVYHDLNLLDWEDEWEAFFVYYANEYAALLSQELSTRLVVVCLREYYDDDDPFRQLFDRLALDFPGRAFSFSNLPAIVKRDVGIWQKEVFKETFFVSDEVFLENGAPIPSLPFISAKDRLKDKILAFNERRK